MLVLLENSQCYKLSYVISFFLKISDFRIADNIVGLKLLNAILSRGSNSDIKLIIGYIDTKD